MVRILLLSVMGAKTFNLIWHWVRFKLNQSSWFHAYFWIQILDLFVFSFCSAHLLLDQSGNYFGIFAPYNNNRLNPTLIVHPIPRYISIWFSPTNRPSMTRQALLWLNFQTVFVGPQSFVTSNLFACILDLSNFCAFLLFSNFPVYSVFPICCPCFFFLMYVYKIFLIISSL